MSSKRGDANWFMISLIIVVLTLAVILGFFMSFNWNTDIDRTTCKESLLARAALPEKIWLIDVNAKDLVSVACATKRICVTTNIIGDNCKEALGNKYVVNRVSGSPDEIQEKIRMILAREMADCHSMTGESNLQIFNRKIGGIWTSEMINAIICSRVYFDSTITEKSGVTKLSGLSTYLMTHQVPSKTISYWDYLRNSPDGDTLQIIRGNPVKELLDLDLTKEKAIFYLESSPNQVGELIGGIIGGVGSVTLLGSFGGAGFKGVGMLGSLTPLGATGSQVAVVGAATAYTASYVGKTWDSAFSSEFAGKESVGGVFLTDYSAEGFEDLKKYNLELWNIA